MVSQYNLVYGDLDIRKDGDTLTISDDWNTITLIKDETSCWIGTNEYDKKHFFSVDFDDTGFIHNDIHYDFNRIKLVVI